MQTRAELEAELTSRLQVAANSTLYPAARITQLIKDANIWATQLFIWDELLKGLKTSSVSGRNYYSYPTNMRTNTIVKLYIDGKKYDRKSYEDFEDYVAKNPNSQKRIFACLGRLYFVNPTPTAAGSYNISVWGAVQVYAPFDLTNGTDKTIFALFNDEGNEAIVRKALSTAIKRSDQGLSNQEEQAAIATLTKLNQEQQGYKQRDQRLDHPRFQVPDFFAQGMQRISPYGKFNYDPNDDPI